MDPRLVCVFFYYILLLQRGIIHFILCSRIMMDNKYLPAFCCFFLMLLAIDSLHASRDCDGSIYLLGINSETFPYSTNLDAPFSKFRNSNYDNMYFSYDMRYVLVKADHHIEVTNMKDPNITLKITPIEATTTRTMQHHKQYKACYFDALEGRKRCFEGVSVECAPKSVKPCSSERFHMQGHIQGHHSSSATAATAAWTFQLEPQMYRDQRGVYRSVDGQHYLRYHATAEQCHWIITTGLDDVEEGVLLRVSSHVHNPASIVDHWEERCNDNKDAQFCQSSTHLTCDSGLGVHDRSSCSHYNGNPCQNGAVCIDSYKGSAKYCQCMPGFTGPTCSQNVTSCPRVEDEVSKLKTRGVEGVYCSANTKTYVRESLTLKCRAGSPRANMEITCLENEKGAPTWSFDKTCGIESESEIPRAQIQENTPTTPSKPCDGAMIGLYVAIALLFGCVLFLCGFMVYQNRRKSRSVDSRPPTPLANL